MTPIAEQKCPKCGAPMRFDPASGLFVCDNCGNWEKIEDLNVGALPPEYIEQAEKEKAEAQAQAQAANARPDLNPSTLEGLDMDDLLAQATAADPENLPVYNCVSCGAEVIAPPEQVALTCPYCRNNIVLTNKVSGKLRPDGLIPFKIQSKDLPASVRNFYRGKKLLPRGFFSEARMGKVTGVYVPFWIFSGKVSGELRYRGVIAKSHRQGDYVITDTKYYSLVRDAALDFRDLPVDAGSKMDDRLMDSLEPFDLGDAQSFDMRYLAGFTADRFDQTDSDLASRAKKRMTTSVLDLTHAAATRGYGSTEPRGQSLKADLSAKYLLFPVYMFDVSHKGKNYHFAVNGQTGKVVGNLPADSSVSAEYFAKHAGFVSALIFLANFILYLTGH